MKIDANKVIEFTKRDSAFGDVKSCGSREAKAQTAAHQEKTTMVLVYYTLAQALSDGVLIDVTETAREAGIRYPTLLTRKVWESYVRVPENATGQDEDGRLWDILWMFRCGVLQNPRMESKSECPFQLSVRGNDNKLKLQTLKALCGPGDDDEPVIIIMMPSED